jgi:8-oxo-dGTP diphosphatase
MLRVVVGLLADSDGNILISQRRTGTHMAGRWEFPGGKRRTDETALEALRRELREELDVQVEAAEPLIVLEHEYPDRHVELDTWLVTSWRGPARGCEGQALRWVAKAALADADLLEADTPIIAALLARAAADDATRAISSS